MIRDQERAWTDSSWAWTIRKGTSITGAATTEGASRDNYTEEHWCREVC